METAVVVMGNWREDLIGWLLCASRCDCQELWRLFRGFRRRLGCCGARLCLRISACRSQLYLPLGRFHAIGVIFLEKMELQLDDVLAQLGMECREHS